jgi:hypothetical protein
MPRRRPSLNPLESKQAFTRLRRGKRPFTDSSNKSWRYGTAKACFTKQIAQSGENARSPQRHSDLAAQKGGIGIWLHPDHRSLDSSIYSLAPRGATVMKVNSLEFV